MELKVYLVFLGAFNPFWDGSWPKNRHPVEWFFIVETDTVLEKLEMSIKTPLIKLYLIW